MQVAIEVNLKHMQTNFNGMASPVSEIFLLVCLQKGQTFPSDQGSKNRISSNNLCK